MGLWKPKQALTCATARPACNAQKAAEGVTGRPRIWGGTAPSRDEQLRLRIRRYFVLADNSVAFISTRVGTRQRAHSRSRLSATGWLLGCVYQADSWWSIPSLPLRWALRRAYNWLVAIRRWLHRRWQRPYVIPTPKVGRINRFAAIPPVGLCRLADNAREQDPAPPAMAGSK